MQTVEAFQEEQWMAHFQMSPATFYHILDLLAPALMMHTTNFWQAITPNRRLAIALWWYVTPGEYRIVYCLFGVGIATVCKIIY